ncbi:MAG: hypothetical protein E7241_09795 [Lachnospiraceae bacterium]|nr:hypothetical protein [Lachnospiraceae bacterium]
MEIMNPWILWVGLAVVAVIVPVAFLIRKKRDAYSGGIKAANTEKLKNSPVYKRLELRYNILRALVVTGLVGSIVSSLVLASRIYKTDNAVTGVKKRDIIMCLDVSYSLYELNAEITDYWKGVVKGLEGDRIGINIFNTSTVTYVPLTDDYDYVWEKLDELGKYFSMQKEYEELVGKKSSQLTDEEKKKKMDLRSELNYFDAGTLYQNANRGSSLVGEGLGTALYSFPYLGESDRTRVIIMCTDNELNAYDKEVMNLKEASDACAKSKVTVYGIFPGKDQFFRPEQFDYEGLSAEFRSAVENTGGKFYIRTPDMPVSEITSDIKKQEAMMVKMVVASQTIDLPEVPFIILFLCLVLAATAGLVLQR